MAVLTWAQFLDHTGTSFAQFYAADDLTPCEPLCVAPPPEYALAVVPPGPAGGDGASTGTVCVKRIKGWVENRAWPPPVSALTQYATSLFLVLKSDLAYTDAEKLFGILAEMIVGIIFGMVAGAISMVFMSSRASKQAYNTKMSELAEFMRAKGLPRAVSERIKGFYEHMYQRKTLFDERQVSRFSDSSLPPLRCGLD